MIRITLILLSFLSTTCAMAQWNDSQSGKLTTFDFVGIGTNSPVTAFDFNPSQEGDLNIYRVRSNSNSNPAFLIQNQGSGDFLNVQGKFYITSDGKVGYGTVTPTATLDMNPGGNQEAYKRAIIQSISNNAGLYVVNNGSGDHFKVGSSHLIVDNAGFIGLGTDTPLTGVDFNPSQEGDLNIFRVRANSNSNPAFLIQNQGSGDLLNVQGKFYITSDGKVGYGTITPTATLDMNPGGNQEPYKRAVIQSKSNNAGLYVLNNGSGDHFKVGNSHLIVDNAGFIGLGTDTPLTGVDFNPSQEGDLNIFRVRANSNTNPALLIQNEGSGDFLNVQGKFYITSDGKVGYGTVTPTATLDLNPGGNQEAFKRARIQSKSNNPGLYVINDGSGDHFKVGSSHLIVDNAGSVGIGMAPVSGNLLSVKGAVTCESVKVEILPNTAPDFVFSESYERLSLEETKQYIDEHHHLPEVPSAKKMESEGLDLREMNLMLLQKVEEMTLHMIEMNAELQAQKAAIASMKKE